MISLNPGVEMIGELPKKHEAEGERQVVISTKEEREGPGEEGGQRTKRSKGPSLSPAGSEKVNEIDPDGICSPCMMIGAVSTETMVGATFLTVNVKKDSS